MAFTAADLAAIDTGLTGPEAAAYLRQWEARYPEIFTAEQARAHRAALTALTAAAPVTLSVQAEADGTVACTVIAFDYPALFSLITGLLGAAGFDILAGEVFTSLPPAEARPRRAPRPAWPARPEPRRRTIIDHFRGRCAGVDAGGPWGADLLGRLRQVVDLLERGGAEGALRARHLVYAEVARRMAALQARGEAVLYPVEIEVDTSGTFTRLLVRSQDTPFFLYSLTNALALRGITIERVSISTSPHGEVSDCIDIRAAGGGRIDDRRRLDELRFSIALTKQFTYCLGTAPDPYAALTRFERLANDLVDTPERGRWLDRFSQPGALQDLARILGASDFLWEDFLRTQYETLLPLLQRDGGGLPDTSPAALRARLAQALAGATDLAARRAALNAWKDREMVAIDVHHILRAEVDVRRLAEPLTRLAEVVIEAALGLASAHLAARHGTPRTVGGLPTSLAVCGLGKLGGVALGYASDIELLFVYADHGRSDGPEPLGNAEYFERLVQETIASVSAKREGVFQIDLRLRPYGKAGPLACSLDHFCRYYGPGGPALSYERLALVRLRALAGDPDLGARLERLRDQFLYESSTIAMADLHDLRRRQVAEKVAPGQLNAKFSPGALVDVEYCVQMLQVQHGGRCPAVRTPRVHEAIAALADIGILAGGESQRLTQAYDFLRRLINALRLLRGNALDLCLPDPASLEYRHLARRMGYQPRQELDVDRQLYADFATATAVVRRFVQQHVAGPVVAASGQGNVVDLLLHDDPPAEPVARILGAMGLRDPRRALVNLRLLADRPGCSEDFLRLAVLAGDVLSLSADPDMALNNWQRFVELLPDPARHYAELLLQPRRLEVLLGVMATSQFLADTLVRHPEWMTWCTDPEVLNRAWDVAALRHDLQGLLGAAECAPLARLNALRCFRRRQILRIGIRDLFLKLPVRHVAAELADLAETILDQACHDAYARLAAQEPAPPPEDSLCLLAFGKCGGRELNYSSDIDLVGIYRERPEAPGSSGDQAFHGRVLEALRADLMGHTDEGFVYRLDFRLRPYGRAGTLAVSTRALQRYYASAAALWEVQALLKARPIAGSRALGDGLLAELRPILCRPRDGARIAASVRHLRDRAGRHRAEAAGTDIKNGPGGIRDVEFLVQALQLAHAHREPGVLAAGTGEAIEALVAGGQLGAEHGRRLQDNYAFLRRVEHFLQLLDDRQTHTLPGRDADRDALARRVLGPRHHGADLMAAVHEVTGSTAELFASGLHDLEKP